MDEQKLQPGFPGDRSQAAAEKLRALRERANHALDDHRRRLNELESQLNQRVKQLAEEFDAEPASPPPPASLPAAAVNRDAEVAELRRQLEEGRAKHEKFVEQLAAARRQLDALQSQPCASCQQAASDRDIAQKQVQQLRGELDATARQLHEEHARQDKFADQLTKARQALNELQSASGDRAAELVAELETVRAAKDKLDEQLVAAHRDAEITQVELEAQTAKAAGLEEDLAAARSEAEGLRRREEGFDAKLRADETEVAQLRQRVDALTADGLAALAAEASLVEQVESLKGKLGRADSQAAQWQEQVAAAQCELAQVQAERDAAVGAKAEIEQEKRRLDDALKALKASSDAERSEMAEGLAATRAEVSELGARLAAAEAKTQAGERALAETGAERDELARSNAALNTENRNLAATASTLRSTASAEQLSMSESLAASQAEVASVQELLAAARAETRDFEDSAAQSLVAQQELRTALESATQQLDDLQADVAVAARAQAELDQALLELEQAQAEIAQLRVAAESREELDQVQNKFDLALADVQKLKRDNGALREELLRRPAANEQESPELIAVRSERDVLAQRVAELETAATQADDADAQQDRADLQRRFEMAVDDVRQLKQENGQLRDKLAAAGKGQHVPASTTGPLDWAAQRAKLMAMLEEEDQDGPASPARKKERATIDGAISTTDRVVAQKDQEIAALRKALETSAPATASVDEHGRTVQEILDGDEVIAAERGRLVELQQQWEDKVRTAELEISVERAKLARDHASLKERTLDLQKSHPAGATPSDGGSTAPRRRWLTALGLGDDEELKKKKK